MEEIKQKCHKEMEPRSAVAACRFSLPETKADRVIGEGIDRVWVYFKDAK